MADSDWEAQARAMHRTRSDLLKLVVPAPLGGTATFWFCSNAGPDVGESVGSDVLPMIESLGGASAKLSAETITQRATRTVVLIDETENLEDLDSTKTSVFHAQAGDIDTDTRGVSWWRRFEQAFPNYYKSTAEIYSWFDDPTMTALSQAELMFSGYLTDIIYKNNLRVALKIQDVMDFRDVAVPAPIDEDVVLSSATGAADTLCAVTDYDGFSDPGNEWESLDWLPPILEIESERIAVRGKNLSVAGQILFPTNWIRSSEDIYDSSEWQTFGGTVPLPLEFHAGPWGRPNAQRIQSVPSNGFNNASPNLLAQNQAANWSSWIRDSGDYSGNFVIAISATGATPEQVFLNLTAGSTLPTNWARFDVSTTFTGAVGPAETVRGQYFCAAGSSGSVLVAQQQLTNTLTKQEYVRTDATCSGDGVEPARGMYGTTPTTHAAGVAVKELAAYIAQDDEAFGIHPLVVLRDLLNRAFVPVASIDWTTFQTELDFTGSQPEFQRLIEDPRSVVELIKEVRKQGVIDMWASESGLIKVRYPWRPPAPGTTLQSIDETGDIINKQQTWSTNKASRITRVFVYYGLKTIDDEPAPGDKPEDFSNVKVTVDLAAEGVNGEATKEAVFFSRWIYRDSEAIALGGRLIGRYRLGARSGKCRIRYGRYPDIKTGDQITVNTELGFATGSVSTAVAYNGNFQVMSLSYARSGEPVNIDLLEANRRRYAWIGPNSLPVDYDLATAAQQEYGWIGNASNQVGAALVDGYYII